MQVKNILFQGNMVRANNEGRKTQTRRLLKPQLGSEDIVGQHTVDGSHMSPLTRIKYAIGDLVYVREAWACGHGFNDVAPRNISPNTVIRYQADLANNMSWNGPKCRLRQGMHMPRWASRATLKITDVRVERLLDINDTDALAEGITEHHGIIGLDTRGSEPIGYRYFYEGCDDEGFETAYDAYIHLWDSINAKRGFGSDTNPWVVAYTYKVIQQNVDKYLKAVA